MSSWLSYVVFCLYVQFCGTEEKLFLRVLAVGSTLVSVAYQIRLTHLHNGKCGERHGQTLGETKALESKVGSLNERPNRLKGKIQERTTRLQGKIEDLHKDVLQHDESLYVRVYVTVRM